MSIPEVLALSAMGLALVFLVLVLLMIVIYLMSAVFKVADSRKKPATAAVAVDATAAVSASRAAISQPGRGSCGEVKLYDVPDAIAAMLMAIVADEMGVPLNELRFISIKEVEGESK